MTTTAPPLDPYPGGDPPGPPPRRRSSPWLRRSLSVLSVLLLLGGVALLGYPFFTNVYQGRVQSHLSQQLNQQLATPQLQQTYRAHKVAVGDSLTRIKIPALGVNVVVVEGTSASALRAGAGHYGNTPLPCETGNVSIAGHRTTYGKPFANLDRLKPGDEIFLETPVGKYTYKVTKDPYPVSPTDFSVIAQTPGKTLTLTTCHPKGSARQRLVVKAELVSETANQPAPA
jgi:sortase A